MLHPQETLSSEENKGAFESSPKGKTGVEKSDRRGYKVWIDLENSPHVPFFMPIIREMEARGCTVVLTARDCFQVCELADLAGLKYSKVGRHYGKNPFAKLFGLGVRILRLAPLVLGERPKISVSHNSRSSIILSGLLGIPSLNIIDYEFADQRITGLFGSRQKKWVLTPALVPTENFEKCGSLRDHILHYPGIKEDVYVPFFQPDSSWQKSLAIKPEDVVVTIRPPATEAHYHNPESEKLLMAVFDRMEEHREVKTILLPRTPKQEAEIRQAKPGLFESGRIIVPKRALNGLDLIWRSDLVISGGGTMNREAAALGVPVYSLFRGALGAVDKHLAETGKLILLQSEDDVREKLRIVRRSRPVACTPSKGTTLDVVVNHVFAVARSRG
jgi:predicted glycosyltransferase